MPIPKRNAGESKDDFLGRCIAKLKGEYPDDQAAAICYEQLSKDDPIESNIYNQVKQSKTKQMTNSELKELVKKHFSLVEAPVAEETFGELKDINGAFTIKFPGETLQVGDKVTVVTTEGQEMDAPDGYHELENGMMIKTEGSVVMEIAAKEAEVKEEEMAEVEEMPEGQIDEMTPAIEEVIKAVVEGVTEELAKMKEKMAEFEKKMEKMSAAPAAKKTLPTPKNEKVEAFAAYTPMNADRIEMMKAAMKNKRK